MAGSSRGPFGRRGRDLLKSCRAGALQDWLPENHLARFIADVTDELDLTAICAECERRDGRGVVGYHPVLMIRVLLYAYAVGITSSRRIEKATYEDVAIRYLAADQHPDHDTIASFRQQHLQRLAGLFARALAMCCRAGLVKQGNMALDGTKLQASADPRSFLRPRSTNLTRRSAPNWPSSVTAEARASIHRPAKFS